MAPRPLEIILARQLASYLAVPILIVDPELNLLFFNESAEPLLGLRFDETGEMKGTEWNDLIRRTEANGDPIAREHQALVRAVEHNEPTQRRSWLHALDGTTHVVDVLGFPLETTAGGMLGAAVAFWEAEKPAAVPVPAEVPAKHLFHSGHPVEVILLRRLFDRLTMPTFAIGADGQLLFYNPAAAPLIGRNFEGLGAVEIREWYAVLQPKDADGTPIAREHHPMYVALNEFRPDFRQFQFEGLDGVSRTVAGVAFPLVGQCQRMLGAVGIFWDEIA